MSDEDDLFAQLRDLASPYTVREDGTIALGPGPHEFDDVLRLSYHPGDYTKQVQALDDVDRHKYEELVREWPGVESAMWQAEAEAETVITGWRKGEADHCRTARLAAPVAMLASKLFGAVTFDDRGGWVILEEHPPPPDGWQVCFEMLGRLWDRMPPCRGKLCDGCADGPWWKPLVTGAPS